jgi:GDP-L-fucose synthase
MFARKLRNLWKDMNKNDLIYLPGSTGLVGTAVKKKLISEGYTNIL